MRTGSAPLDRRFNARTDHPVEFKMLTAGTADKEQPGAALLFLADRAYGQEIE